jgi:hypothetical protein
MFEGKWKIKKHRGSQRLKALISKKKNISNSSKTYLQY